MKQSQIPCLALLLICALVATPASALVNGQAPDEDDTRFDAVAAFSRTNWLIDNPTDKHVHNWFGGAVLIAPDVVLFAKHLLPNGGRNVGNPNEFMVRFRRHADGTIGSKAKGPDSYHQVPIARIIPAASHDLALGILAKPVEHITPVKLRLLNDPLTEHTAILAGWGSESNWQGNTGPRNELRVGSNTITATGRACRILSFKTETRENNQGQPKRYIIDENAVPNMHDSGGSMFIEDDQDQLILVGIIATYTGGSYLPHAAENGFPLEAATQGGRTLLRSLENE